MNEQARFLLLLAVLCWLAPRNLAAQIAPMGPAVQADTTRTGWFPGCPRLAVAADGSFEIVWDYQGSGDFNAYGRHYDSDGEPTGASQVRIGPAGDVFFHARVDFAIPLQNGFQVYISRDNSPANDPPIPFRQRLSQTGAPVGAPVALKPGARFLVGPDGRLYLFQFQAAAKNLTIVPASPEGEVQGPRIVLNSRPIDMPVPATLLASLGDGGFVALWKGVTAARRGAPGRQVLRARIFHQGAPQGQDFDVNVSPGGPADRPPHLADFRVVGDPSGRGFAAVWTILDAGFNLTIRLRFFDASGRPRTPEIVAVPNAHDVRLLAAALDDDGNLLLLWRPPLDGVLRARRFASVSGAPLGPAFQFGAICGDAAFAEDSWLIAYRIPDGSGQGAIVWRRFTP